MEKGLTATCHPLLPFTAGREEVAELDLRKERWREGVCKIRFYLSLFSGSVGELVVVFLFNVNCFCFPKSSSVFAHGHNW